MKIISIIISLIIIFSLIIPTIVLAVEEIDKQQENTAIVEESIEKKENYSDDETTKNDVNTTNDSIQNVISNENNTNNNIEKNIDKNIIKEENVEKINIDNKNAGTKSNNTELKSNITTNSETSLSIAYRTHVQDEGWQEYVQDGKMAGTSGKGLRLEAINIQLLNNIDEKIGIKYQVHIEEIGWQEWKQNGEMAGTSGKGLRLEGIKISLEHTEDYSIMYRVHVQDVGWQEWKYDGEMAGTSGKALRLEAIEIKIVEKQKQGMLYIDKPVSGSTQYDSESSNITVIGWKMATVSNTYIKGYINETEIDSELINYYERPDVVQAITGYGTSEQNPQPGFKFNIDISNLDSGNYTIKIELYSSSGILTTTSTTIVLDKGLQVKYRTHVENEGWQKYVKDGELSGTSGKALKLEALNINLVNNLDEKLNIKYQVHVQDIGWQEWKYNGEMAGTSGKNLRLEAIRICLENTQNYSVMYRVHIQNIGWQEWKNDGEIAGTSGEGLRLEAIEIKIVEKRIESIMYIDTPTNGSSYYEFEEPIINVKGWKMANVYNTYIRAYVDKQEIDTESIKYHEREDVITTITNYGTAEQNPQPGFEFDVDISNLDIGNHTITIEVYDKDKILTTDSVIFSIDNTPYIKYSAHVQDIGWQEYVENGEIIGTIGKSLKVEALKVKLINVPSTVHIKYKSYVEGIGWTNYVQDGEQSGTTGENRKIEAIQIQLEGLEGYTIEYQAHVQNIGWQPWASNGMNVGTIKQGLRIEALRIRIIKTEDTVVPQIKYSSYETKNGWTSYSENGNVSGSTANGLKMEAIKIALENSGMSSNVKYKVHVQERGWLDYVQNDVQSGTGNSSNGIEAIKIELNGLDGYSVEYRVYVIGQGWQEWVCDGELAGTTGKNLQISAIQIRLNIKTYINKSDLKQLDESKYPGYKELLQQIQNQHPEWIIKIKYTGLDWNTVIENEYGFEGTSPRNLTQAPYLNEWKSAEDNNKYDVSQSWYRASKSAIAYMMDPRNSLEEAWIFQFQDLGSSAGTRKNIEKMVAGTYLNTDSIIDTILSVAREQEISPFHLVSRMLQEQHRDGSGIMNGYDYNNGVRVYKVYNLFNINVSGNSSAGIEAGAKYAYDRHWFTPEACIIGSAEFLKKNYISKGQSTLYFQKYNVVYNPLYSHQYMQNIRAANDEGNIIYKSYRDSGLLDSQFEFVIPIYENMPATACPRPKT